MPPRKPRPPIVQDDGSALLPLTQGAHARIDAEDLPRAADRLWYLDSRGYPCTSIRNHAKPGGQFKVRLHRLLASPPAGYEVDHANGDRLDNRRSNLRVCTRSQNQANKAKARGASRFKGVSFHPRARKWVAAIQKDRATERLGAFEREEDAARAYDDAADRLFGPYARLNFPDPLVMTHRLAPGTAPDLE